MDRDEHTLDDAQLRIVTGDASTKVVVVAGAGQGKTEVVAARLQHLVDAEGLEATDELLVLSFSRAAVAAARSRLRGRGATARTVVRTFDSFASRVLAESGVDAIGMDFEARIRSATMLLENVHPTDPVSSVELLRHVVVDEVQDLVGDRAAFVLAVLKALPPDAGFTALGDPLQSIYDFQLRDSNAETTSDMLVAELEGAAGVGRLRLEADYRARTQQTRGVAALGHRLRELPPGRRRLDLMAGLVRELVSVGEVGDLVHLLPRWDGQTAVLCRTNGLAMMVSRELATSGVELRVRRPAEEVVVPAWVGVALSGAASQVLRKDRVAELVSDVPGAPEPDLAWRLLKLAERGRRSPRELDLLELSERISSGDLPVDLLDASDGDVVVSTIHRAKGLEFDNVVIVEDFGETPPDEWAQDQLARQLFVAASRARSRLATVGAPSMRWIYPEDKFPHRWIQGSHQKWVTRGIEIQGRDVDRRPVPDESGDGMGVQRRLAAGIPSGALVEAILDPQVSCREYPVYYLTVNGCAVARTSAEFGRALAARLNRVWKGHPGWPSRLDLMMADAVRTVAGPPLVAQQLGIGRWGLSLSLSVTGMARLHFENARGDS